MNARLDKIREILVYLVIIFLPVMSIINVFGKVKINMALSDAFAALIVLQTIIDYKNFSLKRNFPYWWYFTGLMVLMIISNTLAYLNPNIVSGSIISAINEFIKFAIAGVYFFIGYNCIADEERTIKILRLWIITAAVVCVLGILDLIINKQARLTGTITDPNLAATYVGISFYIAVLFICSATKKADKYIGIISLMLYSIALVLTQSRSGIIAFLVSLLIYSAFNIKELYKYITIILLITFIGYFGILNLDAIYFNYQISSSMEKRAEEVLEGKGETISRFFLSKAAFMMGRDHFLTGVGRGNYTLNSEQYYEKLEIDKTSDYYQNYFKKYIPHNTYMTYFAELGLLGLLLFFFLFLKVFKQNLKLKYENMTIISMLVFFMVQAIAVNLENFRGIWMILGISIIYSSKLEFIDSMREYKAARISAKRVLAINLSLIVLAAVVFFSVVPRYTNPIILDNELQSNYITNLEPEQKYVLRYLIESDGETIKKSSARVSIYGLNTNNEEVLLNHIVYNTPNGYGLLEFTIDENIKSVRVIVKPLDNDINIQLNNVGIFKANTGKGQRLFSDYKFIPDSIEERIKNAGYISDTVEIDRLLLNTFSNKIVESEATADSKEKTGTTYFDGSRAINISDKILFMGATLEQQSEGRAKLILIFKCIGKMDADYNIWMHGGVIDKGILSEGRKKYTFYNWDHKLKIKTSEWQIGRLYKDEYMIYVSSGQYQMNFGFWNKDIIEKKDKRLNPSIDLGWIYLK